jgi:hypothetical protein
MDNDKYQSIARTTPPSTRDGHEGNCVPIYVINNLLENDLPPGYSRPRGFAGSWRRQNIYSR